VEEQLLYSGQSEQLSTSTVEPFGKTFSSSIDLIANVTIVERLFSVNGRAKKGNYSGRSGYVLGRYSGLLAWFIKCACAEQSWRNPLGEGTVRAGELGKRADYAAEQARQRGARGILPELGITEYVGQFLKDLGTLGSYNISRQYGGAPESDPFEGKPVTVDDSQETPSETTLEPTRDRAPVKAVEPDAATLALGSQLQLDKAGTSKDLVKMYAAQRSAGQYNMPEIQRMYMEQGRPDLAKWAAANPDLAQREYMKSIQKMGARPEGEELIEAYGGGEPKEGEEIIDAVNFLKKKAGL